MSFASVRHLKPSKAMEDKRLRTIRKAHLETGASISFFKQLIREHKLTKYQINSAVYVSLAEFEKIANPVAEQQ